MNGNKVEITESNKYCTKDIAKWVRQTLKEQFADLKFSVTKESYSGGSSIHLTLLQSNKTRFVKRPDELTDTEVLRLRGARGMTEQEVREMVELSQKSSNFQVNQYHVDTDWQFTDAGKEAIKAILKVANKYNWDKSDAMTDYFDVNYYLHFNLGSYDKPFVDGGC